MCVSSKRNYVTNKIEIVKMIYVSKNTRFNLYSILSLFRKGLIIQIKGEKCFGDIQCSFYILKQWSEKS